MFLTLMLNQIGKMNDIYLSKVMCDVTADVSKLNAPIV